MGWGKYVAGAVGAALGGPFGASLGYAFGAGLESGEPGIPPKHGRPKAVPFVAQQFGNVLRVGSIGRLPDGATHGVIRIAHKERLVSSLAGQFADEDGDFGTVHRVIDGGMLVELPLSALALPRGKAIEVKVHVAVMQEDVPIAASNASVSVSMGHEEWNLIRWLCPAVDVYAHLALRSGPWTSEKVQFIKNALSDVLDEPGGAAALRDRLKVAARPPIAECLEALRNRFGVEDLVAIAHHSLILLTDSGAAMTSVAIEFGQIGRKLCLPVDQVNRIMNECIPNVDDDEVYGNDEAYEDEDDEDHDEERQGSGDTGHRHKTSDQAWAAGIMGVPLGADRAVVQAAYRKKMSEFHPDKYASLPESVRNLINEKAAELNRARDILLA